MGNPGLFGFAVALFASSTDAAAVVTSTPAPDFSTTAWHVFDAIIAVVAGGLAGALVTRFIVDPYKSKTQERLARVESDLATERDERKALRDHVEAQDAKRFDLLHEWRAKAMSETYATLCDLEDAHVAFAQSFEGFDGGRTPRDYWRDLASARIEFRKAFWTKLILFDRDVAGDLTMLLRAYEAITYLYFSLYLAGVKAIRAEGKSSDEARRAVEYDVLSRILTSARYRDVNDRIEGVRGKIEERFRKLFGVTEDA